jgi:hypothetical protein
MQIFVLYPEYSQCPPPRGIGVQGDNWPPLGEPHGRQRGDPAAAYGKRYAVIGMTVSSHRCGRRPSRPTESNATIERR